MEEVVSELDTAIKKFSNKNDAEHELHPAIEITEKFESYGVIPGLKTMLYPYQRTTLAAMVRIENTRILKSKKTHVKYNAAVLSQPVGSGKTLNILSLMLVNKVMRATPDIMPLYIPTYNSTSYIRKRYDKICTPTIILVGRSVMNQWKRAIERFTNLKYYAIYNVIYLRKFLDMITSGEVNNYDIILVKNAKITTNIEIPGDIVKEKINHCSQPYIYNIIGNIRNVCWNRVVVDDFDTIKLPENAGMISALFTWYVSSTTGDIKKKHVRHEYSRAIRNSEYFSMHEYLSTYSYECLSIMKNPILFHLLNVRAATQYIESTNQMPLCKYYVCALKNPNNQYIALLDAMGDGQAMQIVEMLNGDAFEQAAEAAGIASTSVCDIFSRILGKKFEDYRTAGNIVVFIDDQNKLSHTWKPAVQIPEEDTYGKRDIYQYRPIEYKYPNINGLLTDTRVEYSAHKAKLGIEIDRVKANIKQGNCPICWETFGDNIECVIVKCCGVVMCTGCALGAQHMINKNLTGVCANCRANITFKSLIYIDPNIDMQSIVDEKYDTVAPPKPVEKPLETINDDADPDEITANASISKYDVILKIIQGKKLAIRQRVDVIIPNMMKGNARMPEATKRKVLIFANFRETIAAIVKKLNDAKIKHWYMTGTSSEIDATAQTFTDYEDTCALIINSTVHCAGLNLQTATDLIYAHYIQNDAVRSQVAGRGYRLGRTSPLNIYMILYENEYDHMVQLNQLRVMTKEEYEAIDSGGVEFIAEDDDEDDKKKNPKSNKKIDEHANDNNESIVEDGDGDNNDLEDVDRNAASTKKYDKKLVQKVVVAQTRVNKRMDILEKLKMDAAAVDAEVESDSDASPPGSVGALSDNDNEEDNK